MEPNLSPIKQRGIENAIWEREYRVEKGAKIFKYYASEDTYMNEPALWPFYKRAEELDNVDRRDMVERTHCTLPETVDRAWSPKPNETARGEEKRRIMRGFERTRVFRTQPVQTIDIPSEV